MNSDWLMQKYSQKKISDWLDSVEEGNDTTSSGTERINNTLTFLREVQPYIFVSMAKSVELHSWSERHIYKPISAGHAARRFVTYMAWQARTSGLLANIGIEEINENDFQLLSFLNWLTGGRPYIKYTHDSSWLPETLPMILNESFRTAMGSVLALFIFGYFSNNKMRASAEHDNSLDKSIIIFKDTIAEASEGSLIIQDGWTEKLIIYGGKEVSRLRRDSLREKEREIWDDISFESPQNFRPREGDEPVGS